MVKHDSDWEITIAYKNLWIVRSQFFTVMLIFINIWSNSNIFWVIAIQIWLVWQMTNRYFVLFKFLINLKSHSVFEFKGKIKFIAVTYFELAICSWMLHQLRYHRWPLVPTYLLYSLLWHQQNKDIFFQQKQLLLFRTFLLLTPRTNKLERFLLKIFLARV